MSSQINEILENIPPYFLHYWPCTSNCKTAVIIVFKNWQSLHQTICEICLQETKENVVVELQKRKVYYCKNIYYHTVEITVLGLQKMNVKLQVLDCWNCSCLTAENIVYPSSQTGVQWSTAYCQWLLKLQWYYSEKTNTVETCSFCSEKVCSVQLVLSLHHIWAVI